MPDTGSPDQGADTEGRIRQLTEGILRIDSHPAFMDEHVDTMPLLPAEWSEESCLEFAKDYLDGRMERWAHLVDLGQPPLNLTDEGAAAVRYGVVAPIKRRYQKRQRMRIPEGEGQVVELAAERKRRELDV